jgi:hypothetical protein
VTPHSTRSRATGRRLLPLNVVRYDELRSENTFRDALGGMNDAG